MYLLIFIFKLTESRWFDFGKIYSKPSSKDYPVPWGNCSVLTPILTPIQPPIQPPIQTPIQTPIQSPIQTSNTFVQNADHKYNKQNDFSNNHIRKIKSPKKLVSIQVPETSPVELCSTTSSPNFEEPVIPIKIISKSKTDIKKLPEVNNNKIHNIIEDSDIKNGNISSDSSKSTDITDEKTVSYAEIIKHSKPKKYLIIKSNVVKEFKKEEPIKSNKLPPSKKISIKLPDAPFLPNNQHCAFCKNNGEEETVYRTHFVKDELGNVKCPLLSRYTCPHCKATGSKAHTISRCPSNNKNRINRFNKQ